MATYSQLAYMANQEIARHNLATEKAAEANVKELQRSNLAKESETHRSNLAQEGLTASRDQNNYLVNSQNAATNAFNAQTTRMSQSEQARHNRESEIVERSKAATAALKQQEDVRHNVETEAENKRHNKHTEVNNYINTGVNAATGISKEARNWARYASTGGLVGD